MSTHLTSVTLDSEKHSNSGTQKSSSSSSSSLLLSRRRPSYLDSTSEGGAGSGGDDNDNDEFGGASDQEGPDTQFLESLESEYDEVSSTQGGVSSSSMTMTTTTRPLLQVTPSQLQAFLPMGLDNEKHDDIGALMLGRRSISSAAEQATNAKGSKDDDDDGSGDEFGDADDNDIPVPQRLRESFNNDDEDMQKRQRVVTPSQLQAHLPRSLDNEKHEEIGNLMDSRHAMGIRQERKAPSSVLNDKDSKDEDDDEFGDANANDVPVNQYLQDAKDLMNMEDDDKHYYSSRSARVTPSQLQSRLPSGLDGEKHEEITDLVNSRHYHESSDLDDDEFGDADENDVPVKRFICDSSHSLPSFDEDEELNDSDHQNGTDAPPPIRGIDGGKHYTLNELVVARSSDHTDDDEGQEFGKANDSDRPVERCIDRWKDSFNDDAEFDDIEIVPLKGEPLLPVHENLDSEKHDDLGDLVKSAHYRGGQLVSDDDDEFEQAGEHDAPVQKYLRAQNSTHSRGSVGSISLGDPVETGIDHETHEDLGVLRETTTVSDASYGEAEFVSASTLDLPNSAYLNYQVSIQDDEFLSADEIREVVDEIASQTGHS